MEAREKLAGMEWSPRPWLRDAAVRYGALMGTYLSCVFVSWLVVANRVHEWERYAAARNLVAALLVATVLVMPVLRFRRQPERMFLAGLTAWTLLTLTYLAAEFKFTLLGNRMGGLHVFMLGAVSYGFVAVLDWVLLMCARVRSESLSHGSESAGVAARPRMRSSS